MKKIRIGGVPEHFNYPWHFAVENDYFTRAGIEIIWNNYPSGTASMSEDLKNRELDMAILLTEGAVYNLIKDSQAKIVCTYVESPLNWGIHVRASSDIYDISEIKNKRYAISRFGSGSHLMAIVDAYLRGWDHTKLVFTELTNLSGAVNGLLTSQAEIFFWEKFTTLPYVKSNQLRRIDIRPTPWSAFVVVAENDFLKNNGAEILKTLTTIQDASKEIKAQKNAYKIISERYNLTLEESLDWINETEWSYTPNLIEKKLEEVLLFLEKAGLISKIQNIDQIIHHF